MSRHILHIARWWGSAAVGALPALLWGPVASAQSVEVRYTAYGVPHVRSATLDGAAEGYGWAFARENLCLTLDKFITLAGERSRTLGADSGYVDGFVGGRISNAHSDAAFRYLLGPRAVAAVQRDASAAVQALVSGYVSGFNRHVRATPAPGESCREAPWFRPITTADVWRRLAHVPLVETSILVLRELAAAAPPREASRPDSASYAAIPNPVFERLRTPELATRGGSNALAAGSAVLGVGNGGFTFANPHFPWQGSERLYAVHLTVPGQLDLFGATLYGVPVPLIGFSRDIGWSDTHTTDKRSTIYELTLDPADPTRYRVDDQWVRMTPVRVQVPTTRDTITHTFWETRYGPMLMGERLPWRPTLGYAFADPERGNTRMADTFLAIARARSVAGVRDALLRHQGSPWSNITAADRHGQVFYANISVAGYITDAQLARCTVSSPAAVYQNLADVTVLNGSDSRCAWTRDARAPQPGIIPAAKRPWRIASEVAFNSNDSHWLAFTDSGGRLEGYAKVIGPERVGRGERTRVAVLHARHFMGPAAPPLTPLAWEAQFFSSRNLLAELTRDDIVADCRAAPTVRMPDGRPFDLTAACTTLAAWDLTDRLDARGSALFAEFARGLERVPMTGFLLAPRYWKVPFDVADPVGTPRGFVPSEETRQALARAAARLASGNIALDATLGSMQGAVRNGVRLPISGASFTYHMISPASFLRDRGITDVRTGDSYIHAVTLGPRGPTGRFLVTYSQSTNPQSAHFADMTDVFSRQSWLDVAFSAAEIRAAQVGPVVQWTRSSGR